MVDSDINSSTSLATGGSGAFLQQMTQTATHVSLGQKLHLPPFTPKSVIAWFQRAEVHFRLAKITDETTQADLVMELLPMEVFDKISPWLKQKSGTIKYPELRSRLVDIYSLPIPVRAQRALNLMTTPLGDTCPSDAWNELISLLQLDKLDSQG